MARLAQDSPKLCSLSEVVNNSGPFMVDKLHFQLFIQILTPEHVKNPDMEQSDIVNTKSFWNHTEER